MVHQDVERDEDDLDATGASMTFGEHLDELRSRILKSIYGALACFVVVFWFHSEVMAFVVRPYRRVARELRIDPVLKAMSPTEQFFAHVKVSVIVALLVAAPIWMYQFWRFVGAGLYRHERRWVYRFAPLMLGLFASGVVFGFAVLIPVGLRYLLSFGDPEIIGNWISLSSYLSLFAILTLVLGLTFELPVVMALLAKIGIFGVETYRTKRRFFIVGAFIIGAILTPPDVVTQTLMALPLIVLYEFGVFLAWLAQGGRLSTVDWPTWRRRGLIAGVIVLALFVLRDFVSSSIRSREVASRFVTADDEGVVPYLEIIRKGPHPDARLAYRLDDPTDDDRSETFAVLTGGRTGIVELKFSDDRLNVVAQEGMITRFSLAQGLQLIECERLRECPGRPVVETLLTGLADAADAERAAIDQLLVGLTGSRPADCPPAGEDADRESVRRAVDAWRRWLAERPNWTWRDEEAENH